MQSSTPVKLKELRNLYLLRKLRLYGFALVLCHDNIVKACILCQDSIIHHLVSSLYRKVVLGTINIDRREYISLSWTSNLNGKNKNLMF